MRVRFRLRHSRSIHDLSFIPLMALAFALAAGFGAREALEKEFMLQLGDNQEFAGQLLGYVTKAIDMPRAG